MKPALLLSCTVVILVMVSCANVFNFGSPSPQGTYEELVLMGDNESQGKRYDSALTFYDAAIAKRPGGSQARVGAARTLFSRDLGDILWAVNTIMGSTNMMPDIINLMNHPPSASFRLFRTNGTFQKISEYLNSRSSFSFIKGQCDGTVSPNSAIANFNIMLASFFLAVGDILDSNRDGFYASSNDFFRIDAAGQFAVDSNSFNIAGLTNNMSIAQNGLSDMSYADLTNLIAFARSSHDMLEDIITLFQSAVSSLHRIDDVKRSMTNVSNGMASLQGMIPSTLQMASSMIDAQITNVDAQMRSPVNTMAVALNMFHYTLAGVNAYPSNDVLAFTPSAWSTHSGGIKAATDSALSVINSLAAFSITPAMLTNWTSITNSLSTNDITAYSNFISNFTSMSNEITNMMGMLSNFFTNWSF